MNTLPLIRDIAKQALTTGYLTQKAEEELRTRLRKKYDLEDFEAFITLQRAVVVGAVRQESRELLLANSGC